MTNVVSLLWLPQANVLGGEADNVTFTVNNTRSSTAGADINA